MQQSFSIPYNVKDLNMNNQKTLSSCEWSGDGKYIGTCFSDKQVKIAQLEPSGSVRVIQSIACNHSMKRVIWNPVDNTRFAITGQDKSIELYDVRVSRATSKIPSLGDNVHASWSPNGNYLVTANYNNNLCVFDTRDSKMIKKASFHYELNEIAWTAGSDHILCSTEGISRAGEIEIIAFKDSELRLVDSVQAHTAICEKLVLDRGFNKMAVGSIDLTVSLWDLEDLICTNTIVCEATMEGLSFSGSGRHIAVALNSNHLMICDTDSGHCVLKIDTRHNGRAVAWHPTENLIALGIDDKGSSPCSMRMVSFPAGI
jgi:THO complex subunit 3